MDPKIQSLLKELEKTRHIYWNISPEVGQFLNDLILENNIKSALEIGSSNGYSGIWIAEALSHTNGILHTIESHKKERYALGHENYKKAGLLKNINHILGHAPEAIPKDEKYDLAFFDATKYEHPQYFEIVKPLLNDKAIIVTDNINSHKEMFEEYLKIIFEDKDFNSEIINIGTGILISRKI